MSCNIVCVFPVDAVELSSAALRRIISWKDGRREGGESTSPWFIASAEQRRGEGSEKKRMGSISEWRIAQKIFESEFLRVRKKEGDWHL